MDYQADDGHLHWGEVDSQQSNGVVHEDEALASFLGWGAVGGLGK